MRSAFAVVLALTTAAVAQPSTELTREFQAGVDAFRLGKYDEARAHLEKVKALDPKLPGPNRFLAAVAQAQQRWQDCIDAARLAIQLNPRSAEIAETRKVHDECRVSAGRAPYHDELGDSAAISVVTSVPGATVKVGGLVYGGTPLAPRPITAGTLDVEIDKAGWKPLRTKVEALPGIVTDVIVDLEPDPTAASNVDIGPKPVSPTTGRLIVPGDADISAIRIDAQTVTPADHMLDLAPGTHVVEIDRPGYDTWRRRVRVGAGQKTKLAPDFVATAPREGKEHLGIALVGAGAAVAVFGFYAALHASDATADAREIDRVESAHPPEGTHTRADWQADVDRAKKWRTISAVSFGGALAVFGAGAIYMYLGGGERSDAPPPFFVAPVAGGAVVTKGAAF